LRAFTPEALNPFPANFPAEGLTRLDLETRSLLQALYYVSHGIEIPPEHMAQGQVTVTRDQAGQIYDWPQMLSGLFRVHSAKGKERPPGAHVATQYMDPHSLSLLANANTVRRIHVPQCAQATEFALAQRNGQPVENT